MATRARRQGLTLSATRYEDRARELDRQALQVRGLVLAGVGAADNPPEES
jgi:hypothetical protein